MSEATKELARDIAEHVAQVPSHAHGNPYMRPRNAATLIIIDRKGKEPKVLMGRRHSGHKFMPGKFVFPGGGRALKRPTGRCWPQARFMCR